MRIRRSRNKLTRFHNRHYHRVIKPLLISMDKIVNIYQALEEVSPEMSSDIGQGMDKIMMKINLLLDNYTDIGPLVDMFGLFGFCFFTTKLIFLIIFKFFIKTCDLNNLIL